MLFLRKAFMDKLKRYLPHITLVAISLLAFFQVFYLFRGVTPEVLKEFYPWRFHTGECLQNGEFPWWNPFRDMGTPDHADPYAGTWYPFTWLIGGTAGYSLTTLKIEFWTHIFLGSIGIMILTRTLIKDQIAPIITAALYLVSGFFAVSADQLLIAVSFCWLPYVLAYFIRLCRDHHHTDAIKASLFLFLLLTGGERIVTIPLILILILLFIIYGIRSLISRNKRALWKLSFRNFQLLTYTFLFSLPMLASLYQARPFLDGCETDTENTYKHFSFSTFSALKRDYPLLYTKLKENSLLMLSDSLNSTEDMARFQSDSLFEKDQLFVDPYDLEYLKKRTLYYEMGDTAILRSYDVHSFHIKTSTKNKCLLTLHQKQYTGWKATVNGRKVRIFKSNLNFMTIVVPPGENEVKFEYTNPFVKYAFYTSLFFLTTALTTLAYSQWKKMRRQV